MDIIIMAAFIIGVIVLIGIALWIKRHTQHKDKIPLFKCSIANEGKESDVPDSVNVYDCVEANEDTGTSKSKENSGD